MGRAETTVFLYPIDEQADEVLPSDETGTGPDLQPVDPDAVPEIVDGFTGPARQLGDGLAFTSAENTGDADIRRDMTAQAILELDFDAQVAIGTLGIVVGGGTCWQLSLAAMAATERHVRIRLGWEDTNLSGSLDEPELAEDGVVVGWPENWVLLTATRRWLSPTEVRVRYYLQDQLVGENISPYGAIEPSFSPYLTMGCRRAISGPPDFEAFLAAKIDSWKVTDFEMTAEEVEATFKRLAVHQPAGGAMVRACQPPGQVYSEDPDSAIQRELAIDGDALGLALAKLEELRTDFSPARAWSMLDDWERICRLPPKLLDTVETRRNRVLSFLRKVHGHSVPGVQEALAAAMDLDPDQVEVLEYVNLWTDDFATAVASWWRQEHGGITIVSGEVKLELDNAVDGRWPLTLGQPTILWHSIDGDVLDNDPAEGADVTIELSSVNIGNGCHVGLVAWNLARQLFFFGYYRTGGVTKLGWRKWSGGGFGAFTALEDPAPALSQWLRMRFDGGTAWRVWWNGTGPDELDNETAIPAGIALPRNVGLAIFQDTDTNPSAADCTFDDYRGFFPNGLRVFNWYAYRDPLLDGSPDMPGARAIVAKLKPAETEASAVTVTTVKCDSADSLCDDGPLG